VTCSSFDVAKGSNIARSHLFRKHANHSMPISPTANIWLNSGENGRRSGEKRLQPGVGFPDGHLFLGQRGPLAERGIREIIAKLGQAAKLSSPLGPHDLRHTFAKSFLDPAAYGLDRPPMPLSAIQQLLGHADIATTTIYTRVSADDLARMMGLSETL
jgi:site-specific recombinase XerD